MTIHWQRLHGTETRTARSIACEKVGRRGPRILCAAIVATLGFTGPALSSTVYSGVTFPDGDISFADAVVDFAVGDGVLAPYDDPTDVLGAPDFMGPGGFSASGAFALGSPGRSPDNLDNALFGFVTVEFTDNALTTSGDATPDLFIFEVGSANGGVVEDFRVEISTDNAIWIDLGVVSGNNFVGLDIDGVTGINSGDVFTFVRVTDALGGANSGSPFSGPDIDAIGAISSTDRPVSPVSVVPLPAPALLLLTGMAGLFGTRWLFRGTS